MKVGSKPSAGLAAVAALVLSTSAFAGGSVQPTGSYNWSGLYIGGSLGGMWGNIEHDHYAETVAPGRFVLNPGFSSAVIGGHVGYQYQFGNFVLGVEAGLSGPVGDHDANQVCPPPIQPNSTCNHRLNTLFTVGPRLGWASNNWLFFVTGGYARGDLESFYTFTSSGGPRFPGFEGGSKNDGWFAGGGVEWAVAPSVILGLEYQHYELEVEARDDAARGQ